MIVIQVVLIISFLTFFLWFLSNPTSHQISAWIKILTLLFTFLAILAVIFPDLSNNIANAFGVKTGANLLLYALTLAFIFAVVSIYLKNKRDEKRLALIVRRLALLEAKEKYRKRKIL
jgi:hypothetical protein